jgi:putative peptidoglycan lipid II flippase
MQVFMPNLMLLLAPGFAQNGAKFELSVLLCRITMPYLIFISSSAIMGAMLNSINRFMSFAAAPIILNFAIIISCLIQSSQYTKTIIVSLATIVGGILQLAFMYYNIRSNNLNIKLSCQVNYTETKYFLKQMLPAVINAGIVQISLFISNSMASFVEGAISILSYSERIYQFPLSLIGTAFGTVLLPQLSKLYNSKNLEEAEITQEKAVKFALYISIPCAVGIFLLADFIIHIVYQRGAFTQQDTITTAECLACFSLGLPAFILNKVFVPIFFANSDQKTPLKITIYSMMINILLNIIFMKKYGAAGIAMASSITAWINALLLYRAASKYFTLSKEVWKFILKTLICNLSMAITLYYVKLAASALYYQSSFILKALSLTSMISVGAISYLIFSIILGIVTKKELLKLKEKF